MFANKNEHSNVETIDFRIYLKRRKRKPKKNLFSPFMILGFYLYLTMIIKTTINDPRDRIYFPFSAHAPFEGLFENGLIVIIKLAPFFNSPFLTSGEFSFPHFFLSR